MDCTDEGFRVRAYGVCEGTLGYRCRCQHAGQGECSLSLSVGDMFTFWFSEFLVCWTCLGSFQANFATLKVSCFHIEVALPCMVRDILHGIRVHSAKKILNENVSGIYSRI